MYALKSKGLRPSGKNGVMEKKWVPILTSPEIIGVYSQSAVKTLHQKNLLLLGEDRFLSTVMLRNFPSRKMMFIPEAQCQTVVPDTFGVLLSQRRRWINSTLHNLLELLLVNELCGIFVFSMQFVIFLELIGTVVLPAAMGLTVVLIVGVANGFISGNGSGEYLVLTLLLIILFSPAVLVFLTSRDWRWIGWLGIYLLSLPIWNAVLPLYAYWHFDDFSWGETRKVDGEVGKDGHGEKSGIFDSSLIPMKVKEHLQIFSIYQAPFSHILNSSILGFRKI